MSEHRTIYDGPVGDNGLNVRVWEHCDHKGDMNLSVTRHGISEGVMTPTELKALGARLIYTAQEEIQNRE